MFKLKGICCKVGNIDDGQTRLGALLQSLLVNFALANKKTPATFSFFQYRHSIAAELMLFTNDRYVTKMTGTAYGLAERQCNCPGLQLICCSMRTLLS